MGKNKDEVEALFDAFEKELTEIAQPSGREIKLHKKWRVGAIKMAKRKGLTVRQLVDEFRPIYVEAVRQANQVDFADLDPEGERFSVWAPPIPTRN